MGLEIVELVLVMEEAFGVELKDEEVTQAVTPRMLGDVIFSKLQSTEKHICQSQRAFYILRKAFLSIFDIERKSIIPDMQIQSLIAKSQEKKIWERIKTDVAARSWPQPVRPIWISVFIIMAAVAILGITIYVAALNSFGLELTFIIALILTVLFAILAARLTRPFRTCIPSCIKSVRDLIPYVITSEQIAWTREQVSVRMKQIVTKQLGISQSEYTEDSRIKT